MKHGLTPHEIRTISAAAICDPRSVAKALSGGPLTSITMARIRQALTDMGRKDLLAQITSKPAERRK